jgi:hypothetical protein
MKVWVVKVAMGDPGFLTAGPLKLVPAFLREEDAKQETMPTALIVSVQMELERLLARVAEIGHQVIVCPGPLPKRLDIKPKLTRNGSDFYIGDSGTLFGSIFSHATEERTYGYKLAVSEGSCEPYKTHLEAVAALNEVFDVWWGTVWGV